MSSTRSLFALTSLMLVLGMTHGAAHAQGSRADYERADRLRDMTSGKVFQARLEARWLTGNQRFWYRNDLRGGGRQFVIVDAHQGSRQPAFDHAKLATALSKETGTEFTADHLPFDQIQIEENGDVRFNVEKKGWRFEPTSDSLSADEAIEFEEPTRPAPRRRRGRRGRDPNTPARSESPDGKWVASVHDHNVYIKAKDGEEEFALSSEGSQDDSYQSRFYWSLDSTKLVALRRAEGEEHKVYLVESSPADQVQPKLHTVDYRKPGDRIPVTKPHLFDIAQRKEIPLDDELFSNPWSISEVHWQPNSRRFTFLYNERGHQLLRIVAVDSSTGEAGVLVDEQSKTFIDYAYKKFTHYCDETHEIVWMSERGGWNHLYLYDSRSGHVRNQITKGAWVVRGVDRVDEEQRQIWFRASGIYPEQDPYYIHYARINFDGSEFVLLTTGNGTHTVEFSPDRRFLIDTYSRVDMPGVTELRRADEGKLVCELQRADWSELLATGWKPPERFSAQGRDGQTDIHGVIFRPTNFDPQRKYPVVEKIYAGPHGSFVPKRFSAYHSAQAVAELGFIVVQIDGMGTSNRSKAFHDVCWKNLGDSGFPDRIAWMKSAARKYPYLDLQRVGIYGGSAGGQSSTRALLAHGDFYKVAVSDCGCHDNRMDKVWWNELWMGWPVGSHYAEQSNVTNAHKLTGNLLLTVGELDRNVDPASTMQMVNALIKADKDFDLVIFPGGGHGIGESPYGRRRRRDYFVRHLLGTTPRWEEPVDR